MSSAVAGSVVGRAYGLESHIRVDFRRCCRRHTTTAWNSMIHRQRLRSKRPCCETLKVRATSVCEEHDGDAERDDVSKRFAGNDYFCSNSANWRPVVESGRSESCFLVYHWYPEPLRMRPAPTSASRQRSRILYRVTA